MKNNLAYRIDPTQSPERSTDDRPMKGLEPTDPGEPSIRLTSQQRLELVLWDEV